MKSANYNDYNDMRYYTTLLLKMYNDKEKMRHLIQWKTMHATFITMNPNIVLISHSIVHCNDVVYNDSWIRNTQCYTFYCMHAEADEISNRWHCFMHAEADEISCHHNSTHGNIPDRFRLAWSTMSFSLKLSRAALKSCWSRRFDTFSFRSRWLIGISLLSIPPTLRSDPR